MARIYQQRYTKNGITKICKTWSIQFRDHLEIKQTVNGLPSRRVAEAVGEKIERLVGLRMTKMPPSREITEWMETLQPSLRSRLIKIGLISATVAASLKTLYEHAEDFYHSLLAKNTSEHRCQQLKRRAIDIMVNCGFTHWQDIQAFAVEGYLAKRRRSTGGKKGISHQTSNDYLNSFKQFLRWLHSNGRASASPIEHLAPLNVATDRRHERCAFSEEELGRLLMAAEDGEQFFGMTGAERALLYRLVIETGLRANEARSLTISSFDLKSVPAAVKVSAAFTKNRKADSLPLRAETVMLLAAHFAGKPAWFKALPVPPSYDTADMLKIDLAAAGIPYKDAEGRFRDFHALRKTFITRLARGGVHPSIAQKLARHSTVDLTMNVYTDVDADAKQNAVEGLPGIPRGNSEREQKEESK